MNILQRLKKELVIFYISLSQMPFEICRKFLFKRGHICIWRKLQVTHHPVASPTIHPISFLDRFERAKPIELEVRILANVFEDASYFKSHRIPPEMDECFSNGICFTKEFFRTFLRQQEASRFRQYS